jgi:hypothetical protein
MAEELSYMERQRRARVSGDDFVPNRAVEGDLSLRTWEKIWDCNEGLITPDKVPERARNLALKKRTSLMRDAIYHDTASQPAMNDPETVERFVEGLRSRAAVSGGAVAAKAFSNRLNAWCLDGFNELPDSLDGIAETTELTNYLPAPIVQAVDQHAMVPCPKGGTAEDTELAIVDLGDWRLARLARRALVDQQDIVNAIPGSIHKSLSQLGRAAKRAWLDLAYSTILGNPTIEFDGLNVFHANHSNLGHTAITDLDPTTPTLNAGPLATAVCNIRRQHVVTEDGHGGKQFQHINLAPKYWIVTPEQEEEARHLLFARHSFGTREEIELRVESRLTNIGVRNPMTAAVTTGSTLNWILSCDNTVAPWLLQGILMGQREPRIRIGEPNPDSMPGVWGLAVDVSWSVACKVCDFKGVYFSTPA